MLVERTAVLKVLLYLFTNLCVYDRNSFINTISTSELYVDFELKNNLESSVIDFLCTKTATDW